MFGIGMAVARRIANNRAEAAIPKAYVPIQVEDVPKVREHRFTSGRGTHHRPKNSRLTPTETFWIARVPPDQVRI